MSIYILIVYRIYNSVMSSESILIGYHMAKAKISIDVMENKLKVRSLSEISISVRENLKNLSTIKENEKIYIGNDKKIYKDGFGIFQPITRLLLFRNRYTVIEELEKLFKSYFMLIDNIFTHEKNNKELIEFHKELVDDMICGLGNLKFTYEDSRSFVSRVDNILIKLFYIKRIIKDESYKDVNVRSVSCNRF